MIETEFNLLHEKWIAVMKSDGETEEISLLDVFKRAHEFAGLAGELQTQDVAVLRLLLAVLHAVFGRRDVGGEYSPISSSGEASPSEARRRWKNLWDMKRFPYGVIEEYLLEYEDRFWLFHPERPFYQTASLGERDAKDFFGPFDVSKLNGVLLEGDNKARLFSLLSGEAKKTMSYSEAARWLLHFVAFAETFGKLEARNKTKGAPTLGVGWLGKLGLVVALGNNLFETLMLNLIFLPNGEKKLWDDEEPVWERDQIIEEERNEIVFPTNLSELYTLQSRRVLYEREGGRVTKFRFVSGDFFLKEKALSEQMTLWRETTKKANAPKVFEPKRHDPSKKIWRDFAALTVNDMMGGKCPGVVGWIAMLENEDVFTDPDFIVRFMTASVSYGNMQAVINDVFSDSLSFNASLLSERGSDWVTRIVGELNYTDLLVRQLGYLARNLITAEGGSNGAEYGDKAKEQAYYKLEEPFRIWLEKIKPDDKKDETCDLWFLEARATVRALGRELVNKCGPQAYVGREDDDGRKYAAPDLYNLFIYMTSNRETLTKTKKKEGKR